MRTVKIDSTGITAVVLGDGDKGCVTLRLGDVAVDMSLFEAGQLTDAIIAEARSLSVAQVHSASARQNAVADAAGLSDLHHKD